MKEIVMGDIEREWFAVHTPAKGESYNDYLKKKNRRTIPGGDFFKYKPEKVKHLILTVKESKYLDTANKYLPCPLVPGERVINLGRQGRARGYIVVRRTNSQHPIGCFSRNSFTYKNTKDAANKS